ADVLAVGEDVGVGLYRRRSRRCGWGLRGSRSGDCWRGSRGDGGCLRRGRRRSRRRSWIAVPGRVGGTVEGHRGAGGRDDEDSPACSKGNAKIRVHLFPFRVTREGSKNCVVATAAQRVDERSVSVSSAVVMRMRRPWNPNGFMYFSPPRAPPYAP